MTIFVDKITTYPDAMISEAAKRWGNKWSHIWTDGDLEELHIMAESLGLRRSYLQKENKLFPHYDIIPNKRSQAIRLGAEVSPVKEFLK